MELARDLHGDNDGTDNDGQYPFACQANVSDCVRAGGGLPVGHHRVLVVQGHALAEVQLRRHAVPVVRHTARLEDGVEKLEENDAAGYRLNQTQPRQHTLDNIDKKQ